MMQTKACPKCGKQAILIRTGHAFVRWDTEHQRIWWCNCGLRETGPVEVERHLTVDDIAQAQWERAQETNYGSTHVATWSDAAPRP
jgi:hypothetical protein